MKQCYSIEKRKRSREIYINGNHSYMGIGIRFSVNVKQKVKYS